MKNIFIGFILLVILIGFVSADWTPQSTVNLRWLYNITGATYVNATNYYGNLSDVGGTFTGETTGNMNWTKLKNYPSACPGSGAITTLDDSVTCSDLWLDISGNETMTGNFNMGLNNITNVTEVSSTLIDTTNLEVDNLESNIDGTGYNGTFAWVFAYLNWSYLKNIVYADFNNMITIKWANITDAYTHLGNFTDDLGDRGYTHLSNYTDDLGYTNDTHLSNFTDDLGDRGYTHLGNFTDDLGYTNNTHFSNLTDDSGYTNNTHLSNLTDDLGYTNDTHLSNFTDDLGDRGYTSNLNFTNDVNYWNNTWAGFNKTYADTLYSNDTWVDNLFVRFTELVAQVGNWTADKSSYATTSYADSLGNFTAWDNITGIPTATPSNGDVTHFSLADEIYDWVIGLAYATTAYVDGFTHLTNFTDNLGDRGYTSNINFTNDVNYWNNTWAGFNKTYADILYYDITDNVLGYYNSTNPQPDSNYTEDEIEAFIFDDDNTANLQLEGYNVTNVSYSTFCNGANCWKMYVNASDYFIIEEI